MDVQNVNWELCVLCQENTGEELKHPSNNKNVIEIKNVYVNVGIVLKDFYGHPRPTQ